MKVVVFGEGPRDIGRYGRSGALSVLTRRLLDDPDPDLVEFEGRPFKHLHHGRGGPKRRVKLSLIRAHKDGADGVVVVIDNDRKQPAERRKILREGVAEADVPLPTAQGLAIEAFEAWSIADETVLQDCLGLAEAVPTTKDPESLDGREGTQNHPKDVLNRIANRRVTGEELARIAEACSIERLEKRCPKGFGQFASEVRQQLGDLVAE